ncbi:MULTISPECIES: hypothetical protein [Pseudomonas]|nr:MULTISPECIES: hypothetical protein [Pseudomonas]NJP61886.1 hypothetical protein [Pseudomonas brassicacearum]UVM45383.1 hypothetical protein LOY47_03705 [Pseudomonas brassicacearum]WLG68921.1 hypothetical protein PSH71_03735 [Pseudomonas brassicacearum]
MGNLIGFHGMGRQRPPHGKVENDGGRITMSFMGNKPPDGKTDLTYTHK